MIFLTELFLRVLSEGRRFLWSSPDVAWNYMDLVLNITSVVNLVALAYVYIQDVNSVNSDAWQASANVRMLRILRLTRVIRVVRIVKIVRFIRALRSLVHSILGTMKVLLWSVFLLFMIMQLGLYWNAVSFLSCYLRGFFLERGTCIFGWDGHRFSFLILCRRCQVSCCFGSLNWRHRHRCYLRQRKSVYAGLL